MKGESRTAEFLAKNKNGRIPLLEISPGTYLPESNAILWYLAQNSELWPTDRLKGARVLQWMNFEQYSHEPFIATSRYWIKVLGEPARYASEIEARRAGGEAALDVMEAHLSNHVFFVDDYSIADIALFAYTHVSHEGGFLLDNYPSIRAWIERVKSTAGYIPMETWRKS